MESGHRPTPLLHLSLMLLLTARYAYAQPPSSNNNDNNNNNAGGYLTNTNFNPSMAIVIVVLISAFFFLGFFSIYIRQCAGDRLNPRSIRGGASAAARSRRQRGLDPSVLETFPTLVYSQVKDLKIGKNALECAVCLCEFEDDETLRLLPKCDHVFHPDCIDAWLASHVTCPVCRSNLVPDPNTPDPDLPAADPAADPEIAARSDPQPDPPADHVAIEVSDDESDLKAPPPPPPPMIDFSRISNMRRARSRARPARFPRSHSTGHSLVQPGENLDRFTLRLPENVRKEIVAANLLQRTSSCVAFPANGEGSSRRGNSRWFGEGSSSRAGRSIRLGRSDRWGSVLLRTLSAKVPGWAGGRRGDFDGSVKKGEGSTKGGKLTSFVTPFDCLNVRDGGGDGKGTGKGDEDESSSSGLARVRPS